MASFKQEFKEFALRGNVMDMAVGIIIGGAFGKIVSSLVDDILMPIVGLFTCLLYTSPSPRDGLLSRMPSSA